eukprot:g6660.t1
MFLPVLTAPSIEYLDLRERNEKLLVERERRLKSKDANGRNRPLTTQLPPGPISHPLPVNEDEVMEEIEEGDDSMMDDEDSQFSGA